MATGALLAYSDAPAAGIQKLMSTHERNVVQRHSPAFRMSGKLLPQTDRPHRADEAAYGIASRNGEDSGGGF